MRQQQRQLVMYLVLQQRQQLRLQLDVAFVALLAQHRRWQQLQQRQQQRSLGQRQQQLLQQQLG
jgi:hypothetical protein